MLFFLPNPGGIFPHVVKKEIKGRVYIWRAPFALPSLLLNLCLMFCIFFQNPSFFLKPSVLVFFLLFQLNTITRQRNEYGTDN